MLGHRPDGHQGVAALDGATVGHRDEHPGPGAGDRCCPGIFEQPDSPFGERLFQDQRSVSVLIRQHVVLAGHHRDRHPQFGIGVHELSTGNPGAHHDEVVGQRVQVVELPPGQNALTVRLGRRQDPRAGAGGDQHDVGLMLTGGAVGGGRLNAMARQTRCGVDQLAPAGDHLNPHAEQLGGDVGRLCGGQRLDPGMDLRQRDLGVVEVDMKAQVRRSAQFGTQPGGGDERLRRHTVVQYGSPADAVAVNHGNLGCFRV